MNTTTEGSGLGVHTGTLSQQSIQGQRSNSGSGEERRKKYKKVLFSLGLTEVVFGSLVIFFHTIAIIIAVKNRTHPCDYCYSGESYYYHSFTYVGQGIWCGFFLIASGALGIKAIKKPSLCIYNANMVLSIISACMMVPLMVLSSVAVLHEAVYVPRRFVLTSLVGLNSVVVGIGFVAAIVCIVHSAFCCTGVCNNRHSRNTAVAYAAPRIGAQQLFVLPNGQYVAVPVNPVQGYQTPNIPMAAAQVPHQPPLGGAVMQPQELQSVPALTGSQFVAPMVNQHDHSGMLVPQAMAYQSSAQPQQIPQGFSETGPLQAPYVTSTSQSQSMVGDEMALLGGP